MQKTISILEQTVRKKENYIKKLESQIDVLRDNQCVAKLTIIKIRLTVGLTKNRVKFLM